ncbi:MAG TPA: hypothetical protein PLM71_04610 [Syntrophorhabdaceae bacterium]|nr:hypothetical protein [Syntrophorhabdaceae bacterium]HPU29584.1 hypothetical protein [Syntrophorhabdaceae bacterium]
MTISDFQINSVIKSYTKHMKFKMRVTEKDQTNNINQEDRVLISEDGKRMLLERIGKNMVDRLRRHDKEEHVSNISSR